MSEHQEEKSRTFVETIEVTGNQLVECVTDLMKEGNTRRVIIRSSDGTELMTVPLTIGVVAGGLITIAAPLLAALGALAALVSKVKLEVIREADKPVAELEAEKPPEAPPPA